jgi:hypothetical protein
VGGCVGRVGREAEEESGDGERGQRWDGWWEGHLSVGCVSSGSLRDGSFREFPEEFFW